ncbi:MAG: hypothetical protein GC191_13250 [Azospirillum sp.]|nr:hypothetical protein [Azospirillum sp.]
MAKMTGGISMLALAAVLVTAATPVTAQQAPAQPAPARQVAAPERAAAETRATETRATETRATETRAAETKTVRPRDLMTPQDRQAYRQAMRGATTAQERAQIREQKWGQLRQRAAERGLVLAEPGRWGGPGNSAERWGRGERESNQRGMAARRESRGMAAMMPRAP